MFAAKPAQAAIFTVNGTNYDITTKTGTYSSLSSQLALNPWWGNASLASTFSNKVGNFFGQPNEFLFAPYFAYKLVTLK